MSAFISFSLHRRAQLLAGLVLPKRFASSQLRPSELKPRLGAHMPTGLHFETSAFVCFWSLFFFLF